MQIVRTKQEFKKILSGDEKPVGYIFPQEKNGRFRVMQKGSYCRALQISESFSDPRRVITEAKRLIEIQENRRKKPVLTSCLEHFEACNLSDLKTLVDALCYRTKMMPAFIWDNVEIEMDTRTGDVYLTNRAGQQARYDHKKGLIRDWHICPGCGHEGFIENMDHVKINDDCIFTKGAAKKDSEPYELNV